MGDQRLSHMNHNEMLAHRSEECGDKLAIDEKKEESVTWLLIVVTTARTVSAFSSFCAMG